MYNATVKLCYINDTDANPSKYFPEIVDKQTITIEAPASDLNVHQYFELFKGFLRAVGFDDYAIMDGACRVAFNDANDETQMKKLMDEYELQDKQSYTDDDARAFEDEIRELKEKLARVLPEQYEKGDYPRDDGTSWNKPFFKHPLYYNTIEHFPGNGLVPGSPEAVANFCTCPVMDNAEMPNDKKWVNADCPLHGKVK